MNEQLKLIQGQPVQLGNAAYVCPALNLKSMKLLKTELIQLQKGIPADTPADTMDAAQAEYMRVLVVTAHAALVRNYPDITQDIIEEGIDFNNLKDVALAVLGASGFKTTDQAVADQKIFGQGVPLGESTGTV